MSVTRAAETGKAWTQLLARLTRIGADPEGALEDDELISIELLPKGESPSLLADADELVSYRLEPDGLQFDEPVEVAVELADLITPASELASLSATELAQRPAKRKPAKAKSAPPKSRRRSRS